MTVNLLVCLVSGDDGIIVNLCLEELGDVEKNTDDHHWDHVHQHSEQIDFTNKYKYNTFFLLIASSFLLL